MRQYPEPLKSYLLKEIESSDKPYADVVLERCLACYPFALEPAANVYRRAQEFKEIVSHEEGRVAIVAHSFFLRHFTASSLVCRQPYGARKLANCEVQEYII